MANCAFANDPAPNPAAVVQGDHYRFTLINDTVLRYEWAEDGLFEDRPSTFSINRRFPAPVFEVTDINNQLDIRTASFHVTYNKKRFDRHGLIVSFSNKNTIWGADWRYGEEVPHNLGGTARTIDNIDGRCELGPGILSKSGYSVLDDSTSMLFDAGGFVTPRRPGDRIDGYLFCYGHDYKRAMESFFAISGKQPLLPRWALGNWWSRYFAYTDEQYLNLVDKFAGQSVPLSVAVLDMDWHQVKGDHIPHAGWTGYTWNRELFKDPRAFTRALHDRKLKITLNDHPHAGIHHHEDLYEAMAHELGHDISAHAPILFNPVDPKFMHAYLNTLHRALEQDGCDFWWIDWQQGPYSRIPGIDPLWMLNHFHFLDSVQQQGQGRGLIFSRFAGPGSHRYPVGFSGDSIVSWASLEFQPEFTATASNVGYGWWSHDIGGHMCGTRDDELAARWLQFGVFSPIMRLHSSCGPFMSKEPWLYRPEFAAVMQNFLRFRHRLLPYLYSMNVLSAQQDEPIVQPLYWKFPSRDEAYQKPNQYYFGSSLVAAPVVRKRDVRTNRAAVDVWVPPGRHVDVLTGFVYDGDRVIRMYRSIQGFPLLSSEGAIIPLDQNLAPENGCLNPSGYEVLVVVGSDGGFVVREDQQDDEAPAENSSLREIRLDYSQSRGRLTFNSSAKDWKLRFLSFMALPPSLVVSADGVAITDVDLAVEDDGHFPGLVIRIPKLSSSNATVAIDLGENPQLSSVDITARVQGFLMDFQMDMGLKEKIWSAIQSSRPTVVKIGQLETMGLGEDLLGPVMELLLADSR
ncbi:hypothetical protein N0V88_008042 [Collariella sp. IMI 366227]|nr:hypothetical protein N0V88_008042 [Collariella sp. IMI 366227]